jgi:tetratricopeptide (TPR) repeat protein
VLEEVLLIDSAYTPPYSALGLIYAERQEFDKAMSWYERSIGLFPDVVPPYMGIGYVQSGLGRPDLAIVWFKRALAIDPRFVSAYVAIGAMYRRMGKADEGLSWYEKAAEVEPGYSMPHGNIGNIYAEQSKYEKARESYEHALELNPAFAYAFARLGDLDQMAGNYERASDWYEKAIQLLPRDMDSALHYYLCLHRLGKDSEARSKIAEHASKFQFEGLGLSMIRYYTGEIPESEIRTQVDSAGALGRDWQGNVQESKAHYYLGMAKLRGIPSGVSPDTAMAIISFNNCIATDSTRYFDSAYYHAMKELKQLGQVR